MDVNRVRLRTGRVAPRAALITSWTATGRYWHFEERRDVAWLPDAEGPFSGLSHDDLPPFEDGSSFTRFWLSRVTKRYQCPNCVLWGWARCEHTTAGPDPTSGGPCQACNDVGIRRCPMCSATGFVGRATQCECRPKQAPEHLRRLEVEYDGQVFQLHRQLLPSPTFSCRRRAADSQVFRAPPSIALELDRQAAEIAREHRCNLELAAASYQHQVAAFDPDERPTPHLGELADLRVECWVTYLWKVDWREEKPGFFSFRRAREGSVIGMSSQPFTNGSVRFFHAVSASPAPV